jgi:tetratricopeptide (TPR) repeat protein
MMANGESGGAPGAESNLNILDLASIFQSLGSSRRTGTLKVRGRHGDEVFIYFKAGQIRLSAALSADMSLLEAGLLKSRTLKRDEVMDLREAVANSGMKCWELLIRQKRVEKKKLQSLVVRQMVEQLADLLVWKDIHCEFFADQLVEPPLDAELAAFAQGVVIDGVLLEAARRADEWERINQAFDPAREVFELVRDVPAHLAGPAEKELAALIDGFRDVSELVESSGLTAFEACTTLMEMAGAGYVQARGAGQLIQLAGMAAARGEWRKVLKLLQRASAMDRTRSDLPVRMAAAYEALGDLDSARQHLTTFVRESMERARFAEAARAAQRLVEIDPDEPEHQARLFRCLIESGDRQDLLDVGKKLIAAWERHGTLDRAAEVVMRLREIYPEDRELGELDARIRLASAERTEALLEYEKLADSYLAAGDLDSAVRTFRKILDEIDEECLEARLQLAETLIRMERIDEAVVEYNELAEILTRTGVFDEAINLPFVLKVHRRVAELDRHNTTSRRWLAEAFASRGNAGKALEQFDEILTIHEKDGSWTDVEATLARVAELYPDRLLYRERLAECFLRDQGGRERARTELQALCRASWQQNDFATGARVAERLLKLDPFYMEAHVLLGEALLARGEREAAVEKMLSVALMYMGAGLYGEAVEVFRELLQHYEGSVEAHRFLGAALDARGEAAEAGQHYKQAGLLAIDEDNLGVARTCLRYAGEKLPGDPEVGEALARIESLVEKSPDFPGGRC